MTSWGSRRKAAPLSSQKILKSGVPRHAFSALELVPPRGNVRGVEVAAPTYYRSKPPRNVAARVDNQLDAPRSVLSHTDALAAASTRAAMPMDTELHKACRDKELEAVKELVKGGEDVDALGAQGRTPLQRALGAGAADICEFLLEHSADPLIIDAMKRSSLHWAAMAPEGAVASVQLLFKFGLGTGMLDKQTKSGSNALIMAT